MAKKKDSVTFIKEKHDEGTNWGVIRQIQINRAFYNSQQWIAWDNTSKRVYVPPLEKGDMRLTFNKIKPAVLTLLSKLTKNKVKLEVKPDTNDIERIEVAKAGFKYLGYQWDADDMDSKSRLLKFHMIIDGFPALKVFVDKTQGEDIDFSDIEEDAEPMKSGKIVTQVVDQLSLKIDPSARTIEEIRWVMEARPYDVGEIEEIWGKEIEPEENITGFSFDVTSKERLSHKNMAMVYDYWEYPSGKYPRGRRIVVAGDKELEKSEDPGENPFIFFPANPVPGSAIASGIVTDMTTPQKSYNIKRTAEARILEEMGNPLWLKPEGSVDDEDLVNEIGAIVHYTPINGAKPERVQGASVDAGWQNAMERDEADIEDISGAHEISQGANPRGNNTLGGLQLQVEQDETRLAILVHSYEDGIKKWGEKVLRLIKKHFPEEQQLSIVGDNGRIEAFTFSGSDLSGSEVVDVIPGSSMPTLKAVQDEKIMAMYGAGMFNDPQTGMPDTRKVVRMLGESIATEYFDDTQQDENKALMENQMFMQLAEDPNTLPILMQYQQVQEQAQEAVSMGMVPADLPPLPFKLPNVRDFYDHETHIRVHNRFRKSPDYDELPEELQQLVDHHVEEHVQALMAPQIAEQEAQQAEAEARMQADAEQAAAQREHEQVVKMQDHQMALERESVKGDIALRAKMGGIA